ncbi:MAG: serine/threonine protein kinase [Fuerstiella sp.]|nr:serine/threonine protein kinase [Fuerstiella sp.]
MKTSPVKCNPPLLRQSLEDGLSEQQEEWLAAHLDDCVSCQQALTPLAAGSNGWSRVEHVLRDEISGAYPAARGMVSTLVPGNLSSSFGHSRSVGPETRPTDFAVDFLEPSGEADSIGRINDIEIRSVIGQGGNGIVLKGYQQELNRLVAVKVMAPQLATNAESRKRFGREAQATAAIVHPNVMPILTVHSSGQLPYLVMPYVDCESLQERLDREGSLPTLDILRIGHQVASGLAAAHSQGLVHRDVKPANILLARNVDRVMLTDFGLARAVDDATLTRTGLIAGTPQYMSPEQARGDSVNTGSDLFSLGSVMYAMSTGRPPFRVETSYGILRRVTDDLQRPVRELNPNVPLWLEDVINRLMAKDCESRASSAADVASALQDCIAHLQQPHTIGLPVLVQQLSSSRDGGALAWSTRIINFDRRFKAIIAALLLTIVVIAISATGVFNQGLKLPPGEQPAVQTEMASVPPSITPSSNTADVIVDWDDGVDTDLMTMDDELGQLFEAVENDFSDLNSVTED